MYVYAIMYTTIKYNYECIEKDFTSCIAEFPWICGAFRNIHGGVSNGCSGWRWQYLTSWNPFTDLKTNPPENSFTFGARWTFFFRILSWFIGSSNHRRQPHCSQPFVLALCPDSAENLTRVASRNDNSDCPWEIPFVQQGNRPVNHFVDTPLMLHFGPHQKNFCTASNIVHSVTQCWCPFEFKWSHSRFKMKDVKLT